MAAGGAGHRGKDEPRGSDSEQHTRRLQQVDLPLFSSCLRGELTGSRREVALPDLAPDSPPRPREGPLWFPRSRPAGPLGIRLGCGSREEPGFLPEVAAATLAVGLDATSPGSVRKVSILRVLPGWQPESDLERAIAHDAELAGGLAWGKPRQGHPEGSIAAHVADLLGRIDRLQLEPEQRRLLRFIALVHDACKRRVRDWLPRTGANHHAARARRLAKRYTDDERVLAVIELHDRPYAIWRRLQRTGRLDERALEDVLDRTPDLDLLVRFVELDGSTEGKDPEPIRWFREEVARRRPGTLRAPGGRL